MPAQRAYSPLLDSLVRSLRFFYLLWGGMLLGTLAAFNRVRLPAFLWTWPRLAKFFFTPLGRGLLLGIGLAMSLAALIEVWELVDRILVRFLHDHEREH
jgi:hypothetical protein